jgi:hypothetical protein
MQPSEIRTVLDAWEGADVSFVSRRGDEVLAATSGRLYHDREREGSPTTDRSRSASL